VSGFHGGSLLGSEPISVGDVLNFAHCNISMGRRRRCRPGHSKTHLSAPGKPRRCVCDAELKDWKQNNLRKYFPKNREKFRELFNSQSLITDRPAKLARVSCIRTLGIASGLRPLLRSKFILLKLDCKGCVTPSSGPADLAIRLEQTNVSFFMQWTQHPWDTRNDR